MPGRRYVVCAVGLRWSLRSGNRQTSSRCNYIMQRTIVPDDDWSRHLLLRTLISKLMPFPSCLMSATKQVFEVSYLVQLHQFLAGYYSALDRQACWRSSADWQPRALATKFMGLRLWVDRTGGRPKTHAKFHGGYKPGS
jgi:hypothetical protein